MRFADASYALIDLGGRAHGPCAGRGCFDFVFVCVWRTLSSLSQGGWIGETLTVGDPADRREAASRRAHGHAESACRAPEPGPVPVDRVPCLGPHPRRSARCLSLLAVNWVMVDGV